MSRGLILDVRRFSVDDGPGMRSVVRFKGCALQCPWCRVPEAISTEIGCWPNDTTTVEVLGRWVTTEELLMEVVRDRSHYESSGGGITLSGGEPTAQMPFMKAFTVACREVDLDVGLQTCGTFNWHLLQDLLPAYSFIHFDLKIIDADRHLAVTRTRNDTILENARRLVEAGAPVTFRMPVVPAFTDDPPNLRDVASFLARLGVKSLTLLTYDPVGTEKRERLGMPPTLGSVHAEAAEAALQRAHHVVSQCGLEPLLA